MLLTLALTSRRPAAAVARAGRRALPSMAAQPPLALHCKAGPDGASYGDCPFAHGVRLCLEAKSLAYQLEPHGPNNKPTWLVEEHGGKMPALEIGAGAERQVVTESRAIADEIDRQLPGPSLAPAGLAEAEAAAADFFPALAGFVKNRDAGLANDKKKALLLALCKLDAHLAGSGEYAAGDAFSIADAFLAPKLYHMRVAAAHYQGFEPPEQFEALKAYSDRMLGSELLLRTAPVAPMVVWGWANARGDEAEIERASAAALAAPA